jgi:pimeloyl-ACP methyl ester carboxylesterase
LATGRAGERVVGADPGELADEDASHVLAVAGAIRERGEQQLERGFAIAGVERGQRVAELAGLLQRDAGAQTVGFEAAGDRFEHAEGGLELSPGDQDAGERNRGLGPRRLELDSATQRSLVTGGGEPLCLGGNERIEKRLDRRSRLCADELCDELAVAKGLDRGNALDVERTRKLGVGIGVDLGEDDFLLARGSRRLEQRSELLAGATPRRPEVNDNRHLARALDHLALEAELANVDDRHRYSVRSAAMEREISAGAVTLACDDSGSGIPVVGLHGLSATRRYVLMGSRALERNGHRVVLYDARGHGNSTPPSDGDYSYAALAGDLSVVLDSLALERAILVGASMGAHTAVHYALEHPERVAALALVTPAYDPRRFAPGLGRWDALAQGLREGGVEGFLDAYYIDELPAQWRETVATVVRQRMAAHRYPLAVADALQAVPRSRPFASWDELAAITVPTLIVASRDEADPAHPQATGEAYARAIAGAELLIEQEGRSPIAWQGGQLSRAIAALAARVASS